MKKSANTTTKGMSTEDKEKNTPTEIVKPKQFYLSEKRCPGIKLIFFCAAQNLHQHLSVSYN